MDCDFAEDIRGIRRRARPRLERGAVAEGRTADRESVIELLNHALAAEIVRVLRCRHDSPMAAGIHGEPVAREVREHAAEERAHAARVAQPRGHTECVVAPSLLDMIRENLVAERGAIDSCSDPAIRRLLEDILANEGEHAQDLCDLLAALDPAEKHAGPS